MAGAGLASCSQPIPSYTVMGNIPDSTFNGKTVYIFDRDKGQNIDSAVIENGAFTFTGQIDTAVFMPNPSRKEILYHLHARKRYHPTEHGNSEQRVRHSLE